MFRTRRWRQVLPLLLLWGAPFLVACGGGGRNLVLVTIGGLRSDAVTPDGAPHLAALPGRINPDVVVPVPDTAVALEALLAAEGLDQLDNRYGDIFRVPGEVPTLARQLAARGVRTAAFVGDGRLSELTGLAGGFAEYHVPSGVGDTPILPDEAGRLKPTAGGAWSAQTVRDATGAWLERHAARGRFFLWVHLGDLERAVEDPDPGAAYRKALAGVDDTVADIAGALRTYGLAEKTVLAVVSLHGEALGDRGETGHGLFLSDPVIRVPAWVLPAGDLPATAPADLGALGAILFRLAGLPGRAGSERGAGHPSSATWWPSRLYGWPDDAPPGDAPTVLAEMRRARRAMERGDFREARVALEKASSLAPRGLAPRLVLARLVAGQLRSAGETRHRGELEKSLEALLEECRTLAGEDLARGVDLGRLLVALGRRDEAVELASRLDRSATAPGERLAVARVFAEAGAADRAADIVSALAEAESGSVPELWTWAGDLHRRAGNAYRARQAYERAIRTSRGRTPETLAKLGDCLASLGEDDAALRRYAEAVHLDPTYRYPHARAAEILLEQGKRGEAATALAMTVPEGDDPVATAVERARRMLRKGLVGPAAEELQRALEKKPGNARLLAWLGRVHLEAGDDAGARELLDRVLAGHPDNPLAWEEKARLAMRANDAGEALRCLRRAEVYASPLVVSLVREEPLFHGKDVPAALKKLVDNFGAGRRPRHRVRAAGEAGAP